MSSEEEKEKEEEEENEGGCSNDDTNDDIKKKHHISQLQDLYQNSHFADLILDTKTLASSSCNNGVDVLLAAGCRTTENEIERRSEQPDSKPPTDKMRERAPASCHGEDIYVRTPHDGVDADDETREGASTVASAWAPGHELPADCCQRLRNPSLAMPQASHKPNRNNADEPLLPEVKEERTQRSQFVQGLVLSLMFDDIL
ncbi:hypothetical protein ABZP36_021332 [Zizania latifolia]